MKKSKVLLGTETMEKASSAQSARLSLDLTASKKRMKRMRCSPIIFHAVKISLKKAATN